VTAYNPGSTVLDDAENGRRQASLEHELWDAGSDSFAAKDSETMDNGRPSRASLS
jgi:hypothetical protein